MDILTIKAALWTAIWATIYNDLQRFTFGQQPYGSPNQQPAIYPTGYNEDW